MAARARDGLDTGRAQTSALRCRKIQQGLDKEGDIERGIDTHAER